MHRADFANLALDRIRGVRSDAASVFDADRFSIVTTRVDGTSFLTGLSNFYDEYLHLPAETRDTVLERIAKVCAFVDAEEKLGEIRVLLVPRIRTRRHFEVDFFRAASALGGPAEAKARGYYRPLAEHLGIGLAIDRPEHIEYVMDPSKYGLPIPEIEAIALVNLKRMTPSGSDGKSGFEQVTPGVWAGAWGDDYAAERMLLPELFGKLELDGDPVVFVPGSERIFVTGSNDVAGLANALAMVDARMQQPRGLIDFGFVLRDGAWHFFEPPGAMGDEMGSRLALHLADAYAFQRELLQAKYEGDENAPFIPNIMAAGSEGQIAFTVTTWGRGVHALLPRAMIIGVGSLETGQTAMVPWSKVMQIAGQHLLKRDDLYPPRWETNGFPDDAAFAKLLELGGETKTTASAPKTFTRPAPDIELPPGMSTAGFHDKLGKVGTLIIVAAVAFALYLLFFR